MLLMVCLFVNNSVMLLLGPQDFSGSILRILFSEVFSFFSVKIGKLRFIPLWNMYFVHFFYILSIWFNLKEFYFVNYFVFSNSKLRNPGFCVHCFIEYVFLYHTFGYLTLSILFCYFVRIEYITSFDSSTDQNPAI